MFGVLLRSELLQGSALRTWNCVLNIANYIRYRFTNFRQPEMPRSRRRHHSRSRTRSRSHSHDRDREPKRRRVESPDSSHHRRSVSLDSEPTSSKKTLSPVPDTEEITKKELNEIVDSVESDSANKTLNSSLEVVKVSPKKPLTPAQKKKQEEKLKLRQEREEQRLKERQDKEEQRRREKEERDLQKRKEKEEKDEQKRKEREEKEELKRKEREEKEQLRKKEKEEKEEQKRKEREEKELKKQQDLDEKTREKKRKEEQMQKEKAAFVNFFRKSAGPTELKKPEEEKQTYAFMPFEKKSDMRLAPITRVNISSSQKQSLIDKLIEQTETVLYLDEIKKGKKVERSSRTWPIEDSDDDIIVIEDLDIGERLDEEKPKIEKMRAKLLKFHENRRPAYFGTWRKKSKTITSRKPLIMDQEFFDYNVDSDDDWEEEEPGESLHGSDDEKDNDPDDYEVDNDLFVPHGYLSDEEIEAEDNQTFSPETQKEKLKLLQEEFDEEMKSKTERIKPRLIGCVWENKLIPKIQDAVHKFLDDRMMIISGIITIQKRDLLNTELKVSTPKLGLTRKTLDKELIPEFLNLVHGNINNKHMIVKEFNNYLGVKYLDKTFSKASLLSQLKNLAKWMKCPEEGNMFNKFCWYVGKDVRNEYNLDLELPNKWNYVGNTATTDEDGAKKALYN